MSKVLGRVILCGLLASIGMPASAFCIFNDSGQTVYFQVGDHGIQYRKKAAPESMSCCDWRQENCNWTGTAWGGLSLRVYDTPPNGVPQACGFTIRADGNVRLKEFEPSDGCRWVVER
ncbi:hypothetical protein GCM10011348_34380 [Marinobacterium nitratireducens]|uniref:Uncharacterized protein n=1 Tax=Marinobacterium nitratireducens TaxID=518897 RepID=A0A917ZMG9_9GAMM|nr:hypothetical protein [Marinobacterium nitratireducens]GGO85559.1 hypothetical protein GCM10011348_34380 [Marinobacterium nitratireducens]